MTDVSKAIYSGDWELYPCKGKVTMKVIRCENCTRVLYSVNDDGLILYYGVYVRNIDGICECGHGFHYSVTDRLLERIIERYNERTEVVDGNSL